MRVIVIASVSPTSLEYDINYALSDVKNSEVVSDIKYVNTSVSYSQYVTAIIHVEPKAETI